MKKLLLLASVACFAAANASALTFNPYVAARAKYAFARHEAKITGSYEGKSKFHDDIWGGSIALGNTHSLTTGDLRMEVEYTKNADAKKDGMKAETQAVLFNVYYDLNLDTTLPIKPYAGVGLGWGRTEYKDRSSIKEDGVAMQIGAGVNYKVCDRTSIDFGYRYITYGDFDKEYRAGLIYEKVDYKPRAHELLLGLRYEFK